MDTWNGVIVALEWKGADWMGNDDTKYKEEIAGKVVCTIPGGSMDLTEVIYEKSN